MGDGIAFPNRFNAWTLAAILNIHPINAKFILRQYWLSHNNCYPDIFRFTMALEKNH